MGGAIEGLGEGEGDGLGDGDGLGVGGGVDLSHSPLIFVRDILYPPHETSICSTVPHLPLKVDDLLTGSGLSRQEAPVLVPSHV